MPYLLHCTAALGVNQPRRWTAVQVLQLCDLHARWAAVAHCPAAWSMTDCFEPVLNLVFVGACVSVAVLTMQAAKQHQQQLLAGEAPTWQPEQSWHGVLTDSAESSAVDVAAPGQQQQQQQQQRDAAGGMQQKGQHAADVGAGNSAAARKGGAVAHRQHLQQHQQQVGGSKRVGGGQVSPYLQPLPQSQPQTQQQLQRLQGGQAEVLRELVDAAAGAEAQQRRQNKQQQQKLQLQAKQLQLQQTYAGVRSLSPGRAGVIGHAAAVWEGEAAQSRAKVVAHLSHAEEALRVS